MTPIVEYVIAGLLVVILALGGFGYIEHEKIRAVEAEKTLLQDANVQLGQQIDQSNAQLTAIKIADQKRAIAAAAAIKKAQDASQKAQALAVAIKNTQAAPDDCKAATALMNSYVGGMK